MHFVFTLYINIWESLINIINKSNKMINAENINCI